MAAETDPALADPFFHQLRVEHPDVNIVLLPPVRSLPADELAWQGDPQAVIDRATFLIDEVGRTLMVDLTTASGWQHHTEAAQQVLHLTASYAVPPGGEVAALRVLGDTLVRLGWAARPMGDARPTLEGERAAHHLTAHVIDGGITVTVTSPPVADSAMAQAGL